MSDLGTEGLQISTNNDLLRKIEEALTALGLHDFQVRTLSVRKRKQPLCPDGTSAVWERIDHPDGTVTFGWVCK